VPVAAALPGLKQLKRDKLVAVTNSSSHVINGPVLVERLHFTGFALSIGTGEDGFVGERAVADLVRPVSSRLTNSL